MNKSRKNEVQSRRDFFKKAAKGVLPILGAAMLMNVPQVLRATECQCDCSGTCIGSCKGTCDGACAFTCKGSCKGTCDGGCSFGCKGTCTGTCSYGCKSSSR